MKKPFLVGFFLLALGVFAFAGDAAVFVDIGFSRDGTEYVFGQYGKTDRSFEAYAEISVVDTAKNGFVPGKIFRTEPSSATLNKSGREVYEKLESRSYHQLESYGCTPVSPDDILYVCGDDSEKGTDEITFTDFTASTRENPVSYHILLKPEIRGSGIKASSSFYISVKKQDAAGATLSGFRVGAPKIKRTGVTGYKIDRIFRDRSGKSLVFVIEKTVEDRTGTCIRYMVETVRL